MLLKVNLIPNHIKKELLIRTQNHIKKFIQTLTLFMLTETKLLQKCLKKFKKEMRKNL